METQPVQAFSAAFELSGNAQTGELILYTPLGGTAAVLAWTPVTATLKARGEERAFNSLNALIVETLGTDIPVDALFAWLAGTDTPVAGWVADLSQHGAGRFSAKRASPAPAADLRVVLDQ